MPTFQEELTERRKLDAVTAEASYRKLVVVFALLEFTADPMRDDADPLGHNGPQAHVTARKGDMIVHGRTDTYSAKGRAVFSSEYPKPKTGEVYDREWPKPSITCALGKTPEQMAAEIKRRVMPDYQKGLELARAANWKAEQYHEKRDKALAAVLGQALDECERLRGTSRLDGVALKNEIWGEVQAFEDSVTLKLHNVPVDVAVRLMKLIRVD